MFKTFDEVSSLISKGVLMHIAGSENLLKKLPKGSWIGGSTEYFLTDDGGKVSNDMLFVNTLPYSDFTIKAYSGDTIGNVTKDAYSNGFSMIIVPFDSCVHKIYAEKAAEFEDMFIKNIVGWVAGLNLNESGQTPIAVNGQTGEILRDEAIVLHINVPEDKLVNIGIINIFSQDEDTPEIEFPKDGFTVDKCFVNGKETAFADYIKENNIDTKLPLVADYSGAGINISLKSIENGTVNLYAPVFNGVKYKFAQNISNYEKEFNEKLNEFKDVEAIFSCNCILNFLYGELESKKITNFSGPVTFGEIAYQLVNQTLVYVTVS